MISNVVPSGVKIIVSFQLPALVQLMTIAGGGNYGKD